MFVPDSCIPSSNLARHSTIGQQIIASKVSLRSAHTIFACYLLEQKRAKQDSKWSAYLNTLPASYDTMPIFFNKSLLKELKGSRVLSKIREKKISLKVEYRRLCKALPSFGEKFSFSEFQWARCVVISRSYGIFVDNVKNLLLVPFADMINHHKPVVATWKYSPDQKGFVVETHRSVQAGAPVYESYGRKSNLRFFVNYGFCVHPNKESKAEITIELPDEKYEQKRENTEVLQRLFKLNKNGNTWRGRYNITFTVPQCALEGPKVLHMFSVLRLLFASSEEYQNITTAPDFKMSESLDISPVSRANEVVVLHAIKTSCSRRMKNFPTSLQFDEKLLKAKMPSMSFNKRNCVIMRLSEKRVLHSYIKLATFLIPYLVRNDSYATLFSNLNKITRKHVYVLKVMKHLLKGNDS